MEKVFFLIDMDSFFASCHSAVNPELKSKNLVVSNNQAKSIILTASYNARKFGVRAGMPLFQASKLCNDLFIVETDFKLYLEFSNKIFTFLKENYTKKIEVASIDECYLDATSIWRKYGSVKSLANDIIKNVEKKFNLTCSIGISDNKFLSKSCVDFNKPNGISILLKKDIKEKLWPLKVRKMFGVGISTEKVLIDNNIFTIKDLANTSIEKLKNLFGKRGVDFYYKSNGLYEDEVHFEANDVKSIRNEITLYSPISDPNHIEEIIYELSKIVSLRAKKRYQKGKTIAVVLKYVRKETVFNKKENWKKNNVQLTLTEYTNDKTTIFNKALDCFYDIWDSEPIRLIGVRLTNLINELSISKQYTIFDDFEEENFVKSDLNSIINSINKKMNSTDLLQNGEKYEKFLQKKSRVSKFADGDFVNDLKKKNIKK